MRHMRSVMDVRRQLVELCGRVDVPLGEGERGERGRGERVRRSLLQGLFTNVAEHVGEGRYITVSHTLLGGRWMHLPLYSYHKYA